MGVCIVSVSVEPRTTTLTRPPTQRQRKSVLVCMEACGYALFYLYVITARYHTNHREVTENALRIAKI